MVFGIPGSIAVLNNLIKLLPPREAQSDVRAQTPLCLALV